MKAEGPGDGDDMGINLAELGDFAGYQSSFLRLFGFGLNGIDYSAETDTSIAVPSLA